MRPLRKGRLVRAAPFTALITALVAAPFLALPARAETALHVQLETGAVLAKWPMPQGAELCLTWAHSVTGGRVADCFTNDAGKLVLRRSYLHDFAAGLGEIIGRGALTPAGDGGYWIDDINEPLPGNVLPLRIGSPGVAHTLTLGARSLPLSTLAPNTRARLVLTNDLRQHRGAP